LQKSQEKCGSLHDADYFSFGISPNYAYFGQENSKQSFFQDMKP
jgi:hypothetical protein